MPFFAEGDQGRAQVMQGNVEQAGPNDPFAPAPDPWGAAFRQQNPIVSVLEASRNASTDLHFDPSWNPLSVIRGTPYERDHLDDFLGDQNESQTRARMAQIDQEDKDRQTLAGSGWAGTVASVAAGLADPLSYIPILGEGARGLSAARTALSTAGRMAATGALSAAASEAVLQSSQATRPAGESFGNIASGTILMGLLGGGAGAMLSRGEAKAAAGALDETRPDFSHPPADLAAESNQGVGLPSDAGAAASDTRTLKLKPVVPQAIKDIPYIGAGVEKAGDLLSGFSPTLRVFSSDSVVAKRAMADMAETPLVFEDNAQGVPTSYGAPPLDRLIKTQSRQIQMDANAALEDAYVDYRYGQTPPSFLERQQNALADLRGQTSYMTQRQFGEEVHRALYSGDQHPIAQVQRAAREQRRLYDKVAKVAQETKGPDGQPMLAEELSPPPGDQSYAPRSWNKEAVVARRNELRETFADWYGSEQAKKAAAQDRIGRIHYNLQNSEELIDELEARIERKSEGLEAVENRQEEVGRLNEFAYKRSSKLSQPLDDLRAKIRTIEGQIAPHLDRLQTLRDAISAEKDKFPQIREADAAIFRLIGATQKLRQGKDIVDAVDNATEFSEALEQTIGGFKGGIREAAAQSKQIRAALGADTLVGLEKARGAVKKEVGPYLKQLNKSRRELRALSDQRTPGARGGAVFESEIRRRGNVLADQASGRRAAIDALADRLANERTNSAALRAEIEEEIGKWEGKSSEEAKAALKARGEAEAERTAKIAAGAYEGKGERLTGADSAVDRAVERIRESKQDLTREELSRRADETIDRIIGSPDGRLDYDEHPTVGPPRFGSGQQVRGALKARDFAIPTALVHDFVEHDPQHLMSSYLRSVLPDVMLTQRFGDLEMWDVFRRLNEEYAEKAKSLTSEKSLVKHEAERQRMIRDLAATRDRIRGVYGRSPDPRLRNAARIANVARNWNVIADLGTSVFNRLGDLGTNAVFRHGFFNVMRDGWSPFFRGMLGQKELASAWRSQAKAMAVGVDGMMGHMRHDFGDVIDNYRPGSKFERGLAWAADRSMLVNLHGPWTDWTKTLVASVASGEMLRAMERVAGGKASAKDVEKLAAANIDRAMANRIWKAYGADGGQVIEGVHVPNTGDWKDIGARQAFEAAIGREADISVITPGAEKPLWMSGPVASLMGQFRSFVAGAYERLLIANLQQRDARTLQGLITAVATGMVSYRLYTWLAGQQASDNPADWIKEGVHRSAILAWFSEANEMIGKATGGASDMYRLIGASSPLTRHEYDLLQELLGPTWGRLEGLYGAAKDATRAVIPGDKPDHVWTAQDTHRVRQLFLLQNLFAVRRLFDAAEQGVNGALGIPQRDKQPAWTPPAK